MSIFDFLSSRLEHNRPKKILMIADYLVGMWARNDYFEPLFTNWEKMNTAQRKMAKLLIIVLDSYAAMPFLDVKSEIQLFYPLLAQKTWKKLDVKGEQVNSAKDFEKYLIMQHSIFDKTFTAPELPQAQDIKKVIGGFLPSITESEKTALSLKLYASTTIFLKHIGEMIDEARGSGLI